MPGLEEERGAKVAGKPQRFQKHILFVSMDAAPVAGEGCGEELREWWQEAVLRPCGGVLDAMLRSLVPSLRPRGVGSAVFGHLASQWADWA